MDEQKKTALVTGSSKGIGKTIAICLSEAGYDVGINYATSQDEAEDTAEKVRSNGRKAFVYQADIQSIQEIRRMMEAFIKDFDHIDLLVNNAGITKFAPVLTATEELWEAVINTDLKGTYFCTQAAVQKMVEQQMKGTIVNISSNHAQGCWPNASIYAAAKAGVNKMTQNLALELAPHGIRVVGIAPGYTWLERYGNIDDISGLKKITDRIPANRFATTREIGDAVVYLASASAGYITGTTLVIDGGALLPVVADNSYL